MSERFKILCKALEIIEEGLDRELSAQEVADRCHCSLSTLQKVFHHTVHLGLAGYINRRRVTLAAHDLLSSDDTVLDIAMRYGFGSHEVFIRAFQRIWGETPSRFRSTRSFSDIYPRHFVMEGEKNMLMKKSFDPARLYDAMKGKEGTYALIFDTCHLHQINVEIGRAAGDLVIAECLRRLDAAKSDDMILLRIGGDEYALLSGMADEAQAMALVGKIMEDNGGVIEYEGEEIPVSMRYAITKIDGKESLAPDVLLDMIRLMD